MILYGLIGYPLEHSFSPAFFAEFFRKENLGNHEYRLLPLESIYYFPGLLTDHPQLRGVNVTIPYKSAILPFLGAIDKVASEIQAVNTIKVIRSGKTFYTQGYNTDVIGFENALLPLLGPHHKSAIILGTGGAAKAVAWVLKKLEIPYLFISGTKVDENTISYETLLKEQTIPPLLINCTPLGTYPDIATCPPIPFHKLSPDHLVFDLVYNPAETLLIRKAKAQGAVTENGLAMLEYQAIASWKIWNSEHA